MRLLRPGALVRQIAQFAVVGGLGFLLDAGIFNALRLTVLAPEHLHDGPIIAKAISTTVAIAANWVGNRYWTFASDRSARSVVEAVAFFAVSILGMLVGLACLWVSHYGLHLTSLLADNISSNVVGLLLGSVLRFWLYKQWVYRPASARDGVVAAAVRAD